MSTIAVKGNPLGLGSMTLVSPNSSLSQTLTLPDSTGNVVVDVSTQTLTNKTLGAGTVTATSLITSGTAQASTSGVAIDFTGIPSWVKRITVMFNGVSTNGTSRVQVQLGSGSFVTSGYSSVGIGTNAASISTVTLSSGFATGNATAATDAVSGSGYLTLVSGSTWVWSCVAQRGPNDGAFGSGTVTLSGTLDRVRITTVGGTDTFDAGSINILYE